ncbi:MAG: lysophospholipase [Steroidobacteraceae bacterium]
MPDEVMLEVPQGKLLVRIWTPFGTPRAIVAICHGFNSHSGYYFWTAERLVDEGYAVYAVDLRGRGLSSGERYYMDAIDEYVMDVDSMVKLAFEREGALPLYLLGHSAGGVTACLYALEQQSRLAGLICESFACRVPAPALAIRLFEVLSGFMPRVRVVRLNNKNFSRDPCRVARMNDDPLIAGERQPLATIAALAQASRRLGREFHRITIPTLILHGTDDRVALAVGSQCFHRDSGARDKTLKLYTGHFHDLLNDLGRAEVLADIKQWLADRVRAP